MSRPPQIDMIKTEAGDWLEKMALVAQIKTEEGGSNALLSNTFNVSCLVSFIAFVYV